MKFVLAAAAAAMAAAAVPAAAADIISNPSFEDATLGAWGPAQGAGNVALVATATPVFGADYTPKDGAQFALLTAGSDDDYETIGQDFHLDQKSVVSFWAAFLAFDETSDGLGYNDDGFVSIGPQNQVGAKLFQSNVDAVTDFGTTGWTFVSVTLGPGDYTIQAGVRNVGDVANGGYQPGADSQLALDNVSVAAAPVPEPVNWALLVVGFAGIGELLRRRRAVAAKPA